MSIQSLKLITFFAGHYYQLLLDLTHDYRTGQWPFSFSVCFSYITGGQANFVVYQTIYHQVWADLNFNDCLYKYSCSAPDNLLVL